MDVVLFHLREDSRNFDEDKFTYANVVLDKKSGVLLICMRFINHEIYNLGF